MGCLFWGGVLGLLVIILIKSELLFIRFILSGIWFTNLLFHYYLDVLNKVSTATHGTISATSPQIKAPCFVEQTPALHVLLPMPKRQSQRVRNMLRDVRNVLELIFLFQFVCFSLVIVVSVSFSYNKIS